MRVEDIGEDIGVGGCLGKPGHRRQQDCQTTDSSRFHEAWALRKGTSLEDRPRYTPTTTFETFPFPDGLTPDILRLPNDSHPHVKAIGEAADNLDHLRENWLNPPEMVKSTPEIVPGFPDRLIAVNERAASELKKRTLTNLYNQRPTWLVNAHDKIDEVVAAAYGWPADLNKEEILKRLLDLNMSRPSRRSA